MVDCTLRANQPHNKPTTMPLTDDPTMMPVIIGRASGVNQAVAPSIAPRISPNSNPTKILFIVIFPSAIGEQEPEKNRVTRPKTLQSMPQRFGPGFNGSSFLKVVDVLKKRSHIRI